MSATAPAASELARGDTPAPAHRTVIEAGRRLAFPDLRELWEHRDLIYFLIRRDVSARYKQTAVGVLWAVLQPVLLAIVFAVFFGLVAKVPSEKGIPYPVFAVSGLVMWLYFAAAMSRAAESTVENGELISKVYFPRVIIPMTAVVPPLIDFLVAFGVVIVIMLAYGIVPPIQILLLPLLVLLALFTAFGLGLWFSAFHVKYRDVQLLVPFLIQVGLFITPIVYPFDLVPDNLQAVYSLNPMVGILEGYRWMLFPSAAWPGALLLVPLGASVLLVVTGLVYFHRAERSFADYM